MGLRTSEMKSHYFKLTHQLDSALFYANQYIALDDIHTEHIRKNQAILLLSNIETEARNKVSQEHGIPLYTLTAEPING